MNVGSGRRAMSGAIRRLAGPGRWRLKVWAGVAFSLGVGLGQLPLFGVLGYELALVMAIVGAITGLDLGAAVARELQWMDMDGGATALERAGYPGRAVARGALSAALLSVGVVCVTGVVCAVRGIWVETCDWVFGLKAFLLLPVVTAALAGGTGYVVGIVVGTKAYRPVRHGFGVKLASAIGSAASVTGIVRVLGGRETAVVAPMLGAIVFIVLVFGWLRVRPHRSTVVALAGPLLLVAAAALYRFFGAPPVFTYNPILGYFPGNIYDENVVLGGALVWSRVEQVVWLVAMVALVGWRVDVPRHRVAREPRPIGRRVAPLSVALAAIVGGSALYWYSGVLGYRIDGAEIADALGGRIETEHFVIFYAQTPEIEKDISLIAADHELRYAQVVAQIGEAPPGKITSYYFADRDQKARWFGARDVEMAKPWRREIYLDHRSFPHGSLRHEIAHAIASAFGDPLFGVAARRVAGIPVFVSPGLIEGFAVAMDWPGGYERLTPHESVRALQLMGLQPSIRDLLSLQFLAVSSSRSYMTAGSFLRFLFDAYGAAQLRHLYSSGGDFDGVYGKSLATLENEWRAMIATITVPPEVVEGNRERFQHGSVFARPCPHAVAAQRERAADAFLADQRPKAVAILRDVCSDAPDEPRYQLELGDYLVGGSPRERIEAIVRWTALSLDPDATSSLRSDAYERLARVAAATGDFARAHRLIAAARELPLDPNARRTLDAKWFALEHTGPAGVALRGYFFAPPGALDSRGFALAATLAEPQLGLGHYLLGLQQLNAGLWPDAAASLGAAIERGVPNIAFIRFGARQLAVAAYRAGDRVSLQLAIATLQRPDMNETDHLLATDWQQRLERDTTGHIVTPLPSSIPARLPK